MLKTNEMNNSSTLRKQNPERQLVVLLSRLTFSSKDVQLLEELLKEKLDWYKIFQYSLKNKVLPLIWHNLKSREYAHIVPLRLGQVMNFHCLGTQHRNELYLMELKKIAKEFSKMGLKCVPLKGAQLISQMYRNLGIRTVNDMDCLVDRQDVREVRKIMNDLGYVEGEYNKKTRVIEKVTREKALLWQTSMNNLLPFLKLQDSQYAEITQFDFSYSLDLDLLNEPVEYMLSRTRAFENDMYYLNEADFFLHQCCHHYKEASNASWVALNSDLNLIKFCDVREYILQFMNEDHLKDAVELAKRFGLQEAVYFTLFYLKEIYNDGYEDTYLNSFTFEDVNFLYSYGKKDYGFTVEWKKDFWDRLFSDTNKDELVENAKYANIVEF
ncbi:nucleotidyltransferase family protein [Paenibacillus glucanolyticus]|uniref:nucleotidyltransferase family protein n=1 Tax=Paenibacillus glucanolyticus TaxID=59843 RepID=UPI0034CE9A88